MAQPTATGTQLSENIGTGDVLARTTHGGFVYPWGLTCFWNEGDSSPDVVTLTAALPVQPGTGAVFTVDLGTNNDVTLATLPDTATGDLAALVVDAAAIETLLTAANVDHAANEVLLTTIAGDTTSLDGKVTACDTGAVVVSSGTITASLGATDNAVLDAIAATLVTIDTDTGNLGLILNDTSALLTSQAADGSPTAAMPMQLIGGSTAGAIRAVAIDSSGHLQVDILTAPTTAVTGTFWQTTQPVSIASVPSHAVTGPLTDTELRAAAVPVSGTFFQATQPVSVASVPSHDVTNAGTFSVQVSSAPTTAVTNAGLTELAAAINTNRVDVNIAADGVGIGGGTQYTEDEVSAGDPIGTAQILKRLDAPATIGVDNDNVARRGTEYGAAYTQLVDSSGNFIDTFGGAGGTSSADDADFVAGTTLGTQIQGVYESSPTSVTDGDVGQIGITATRQVRVELATLPDTAASDLDTINTNTTTTAGNSAFGGIVGEGEITASTLRITQATDDDGVAYLSTIAGAVDTQMQCDIVASLPAGTDTIGGTISQQSSSILYDGSTACTIKRASGVMASTGTMIAAVAGKKFRILALFLKATSATATNVWLGTTTDTDVLGNTGNPIPLAVDADGDNDSGFVMPYNQGGWTETSTANEALTLTMSAAQDVIWAVTYIEVA